VAEVVGLGDSPQFDALMRRALDRRAFLRGALATGAGAAAFYALGCGSSSSKDATPTGGAGMTPGAAGTPSSSGIRPVLLTSELVAGQDNRFSVGLLNGAGKLVKDANVHLAFYTIAEDGVTGTLRGEGDATFVELNVPGAHTHDSSSGDAVTEDSVAFYVANTPFDVAGKWGVQVTATPNDGSPPAQVRRPRTATRRASAPASPPARCTTR
jgi:hypothetical protein